MSYVIAGYTITLVTLGAYTLSLIVRLRKMRALGRKNKS
jgi:CcmD family protein